MEKSVSVVIPTYNRAHLLERTIPTYLQPGVAEILLVDDASTDNTAEVAARLIKDIPLLRYFRLPVNRRQMYAKNYGIARALQPQIYFGDDDSIVTPDSISILVETMLKHQADIVGAKSLYAERASEIDNIRELISRYEIYTDNAKDIVDLSTLQFNFTLSTREVLEIPVTHACFLIRRDWADQIKFDEAYILNAYREETDFLLRAHLAGARIFYQSKAVQINLPRSEATGGAHASGRTLWLTACVINNWRFLHKNYPDLMKRDGIHWNLYKMQWNFMMRGLRKTLCE